MGKKVHSRGGKTWGGKQHHLLGQLDEIKLFMKHKKGCLNVLRMVFIKVVLKTTFLVVPFLSVKSLTSIHSCWKEHGLEYWKCLLPTKRRSFPVHLKACAQLYLWDSFASLSQEVKRCFEQHFWLLKKLQVVVLWMLLPGIELGRGTRVFGVSVVFWALCKLFHVIFTEPPWR